MYADHTPLQIAAQVVMGAFFIFHGVKNTIKWRVNLERIRVMGFPAPPVILVAGFAAQYPGALMVMADWHANLGVAALIGFTVGASAVFHRFWRMPDPVRAEYHFLLLTYNVFVIAALLLLVR
jgi:putative oxidoreductase